MASLSLSDIAGIFKHQLCLFASALQEVCLGLLWQAFHNEPPWFRGNLPRMSLLVPFISCILYDPVLLLD